MFKLRRLVRDFFGFPRAHVNAFLIMLPLIAIALVSQPIYHSWQVNRVDEVDTKEISKLDSIAALWKKLPDNSRRLTTAHRLFHFDPNQVNKSELVSLGFSDVLASRITNYREKGGRFRVKNDLLKIYGMDSALYRRLYDYVDLPVKLAIFRDTLSVQRAVHQSFQKTVLKSFDLNLADTTQLKTIKGIGSKLSTRILKYRDALGGFTQESQLQEVFGLDTTVVEHLQEKAFIAEDFVPRKLMINGSSEKELSTHPYISRSIAKAIVAYRFQHGDFRDVEELRKIPALKPETIQKITPYLEFGK